MKKSISFEFFHFKKRELLQTKRFKERIKELIIFIFDFLLTLVKASFEPKKNQK